MASIQVDNGQGFSHACGSSVIESNLVLTAAHCLKDHLISQIKIVFGSGDLSMAGPFTTERNVTEVFIHPLYNTGESYYDVAVFWYLTRNLTSMKELHRFAYPMRLNLMAHIDHETLPP